MINAYEQSMENQNKLSILQTRAEEYRQTSNKYRYVSSNELINKVQLLANSRGIPNVSTKVLYSDAPGTKSTRHLLEFRFHDLERDLFGTPIVPRLLVWNSFNAECSLSLSVGVYRLVCSNGLTLGKSMFRDQAIHLKGTEIERIVEEFEHQVAASLDYIDTQMTENFVKLMGGQLNIYEINRILTTMVEARSISKRTAAIVKGTLSPDALSFTTREEDKELTLWSLYNIVNENMRLQGKSLLAQEKKNTTLMDQVLEAAA